MECSYVNGVLYKMPNKNQTAINLNSNEISNYEKGSLVEYKKDNVLVRSKRLVWLPNIDASAPVINNCVLVGVATNEEATVTTHKYYQLLTPAGITSLCSLFSLQLPVDLKILTDNFTNFGIMYGSPLVAQTGYRPVVCSVSLDSDGVPLFVKLYRGNYTPTEEEINTAKLYWAENPL